MEKYYYKRVFLIVMDSVGFGSLKDSDKFGDQGANTIKHLSFAAGGLNVPTLEAIGMGELTQIKGVKADIKHPHSYVTRLHELSAGKDTLTGHWEMMGVKSTVPFKTFTEHGFPQELIDELAKRTGHKIIGNIAASGTEILVELGEEQMKENSLIVYTSADSVLQIAAHEDVTGLKELYRCCEIARELCMDEKYLVGRVIARPFIGNDKNSFKRTPNRHDYALAPRHDTALNILKDHGLVVKGVGKIYDIFAGSGITDSTRTVSNNDGMDKTIAIAKTDFTGLCFVNLVEFDSEWGHRRNPEGYATAIEDLDKKIRDLLEIFGNDDLLILTADHGNDPTWHGTDHTREKAPFMAFSKKLKHGRKIMERSSFADIGATILTNYHLKKNQFMIGKTIRVLFEDPRE